MARDRVGRKRRRAARAGGQVCNGAVEFSGYYAPFVITPEMQAAAAQAAARDAADLDAEWCALSQDEQSWFGASFGELPERDQVARADDRPADREDTEATRLESRFLRSLAGGETDPAAWVGIAAAVPGALGEAGDLNAGAAAPRRVLPDPGDALIQLQVIDRLIAWAQARRFAVVAAVCPEPAVAAGAVGYRREQHLVEEIAVATRTGTGTASGLIDTARLLTGPDAPFAPFAAALAQGQVSEAHVRVLVRGIARVTGPRREEVLAAVAQRVLPTAMRSTPAQLERAVTAAVCAADPEGEADRRAAARDARDVYLWSDRGAEPGTQTLAARDDAARVRAMHERITREARRLQRARGGAAAARQGHPEAKLGTCRVDVMAAMVLGVDPSSTTIATDDATTTTTDTTDSTSADTTGTSGVTDDGDNGNDRGDGGGAGIDRSRSAGLVPGDAAAVIAQGMLLEPVRPVFECQLVMDLPTLRREADNPCLLDGEPIPAPVARELAASVTAWRRMVTDPVTGHLLDYGRRTYLPAPLVAFVKARDGECAAPYCQRPSSRCQMDHHVPHPVGPSNTTNCGALCDRHHPLKTDGYLTVTDSRPDGTATYTTAWGQTVTTSPRPYLPEGSSGGPPGSRLRPHRRPPPRPVTDDDAEPPF